MIIDGDRTKETGRVVPLAEKDVEKTMPLRTVDAHAAWQGMRQDRQFSRWVGPFPVRRAGEENIHGNPPPLPLRLKEFAETAPIADVVEVVKALSDSEPTLGGVERGGDDTATHALPAVEKLTGKPSSVPIAHRTARRVQKAFTDAGWNVAVWYGEYTSAFWVMDENGLHEFADITAMYQGMGWLEIPGEGIVRA